MVELKAKSPCQGRKPVTHGSVTLSEVPVTTITALLPYRGKTAELSAALQDAHGLALPGPNSLTRAGNVTCLWTGLDQAMLIGAEPADALCAHAAVVDQSDGWTVVTLTGAAGVDVLARLIPVDLRTKAFPEGTAMRTQVGHMTASVARLSGDTVQIMVFRSMAGTLWHELETALSGVAARTGA
ncbi:sarcosine oxidase subunit gamma family protein [Mesobacterium sp. TK19101]|uniref:Sarcosine oxidase subunit gamma family protein n=1 Tax=Mesobacterium hydrothermale TaxID=3111907 RepID=A0ABU6HCQ4_9RHOB|nr:sarcosine oxidase subunit gamma family protein [Mesobacterium sp. TK19101]MEC3860249.1 sarcosine oxidase subunit gamma family protein [Mesobacterium sp. TK19101]